MKYSELVWEERPPGLPRMWSQKLWLNGRYAKVVHRTECLGTDREYYITSPTMSGYVAEHLSRFELLAYLARMEPIKKDTST